eukprot:COSAG04_NODE_15296_length_536_cov_1.414188_1_plen_21_part_10
MCRAHGRRTAWRRLLTRAATR